MSERGPAALELGMQLFKIRTIILSSLLALAACNSRGEVAHIHVPPAYKGPVHVEIRSHADQDSGPAGQVKVSDEGTGILSIEVNRDMSVQVDGIPAGRVKDLKTDFKRTGDGIIVGGTVDFTVTP